VVIYPSPVQARASRPVHPTNVAEFRSLMRGSSTHHQSDCGMHPRWRCLGSRIEYRMASPRIDSGRAGLGCVVHGGTHRFPVKHCESLPAEVRVRPDAGSPVRSFGGQTRSCDECDGSSRPVLLRFAPHRPASRILQPVGQACPCIGLTQPATVIFWTADLSVTWPRLGAGEQRCRHREADRLRCLQVDGELELGWLHDR